MNSEQLKDAVIIALEDMKAQDITVLDIQDVASFADYMVVVSGTSNTHVKAIAVNTAKDLSRQGVKALSEEGANVAEWVLLDFGDVIVHVMRPEVRDFYALEKLWDQEVRKTLNANQSLESE